MAAAALFHLPGWESVTYSIPKAASAFSKSRGTMICSLARTKGKVSSGAQGPPAMGNLMTGKGLGKSAGKPQPQCGG